LAVENFGAKLERQVFGRGCCCAHQRPRIHATRRQIGESLGERGQIQQKPFFEKGLGKNVRFRVRLVWVVVFSSGPSCVVRENTIGNHRTEKSLFQSSPTCFFENHNQLFYTESNIHHQTAGSSWWFNNSVVNFPPSSHFSHNGPGTVFFRSEDTNCLLLFSVSKTAEA
jgi:hypothetical protein